MPIIKSNNPLMESALVPYRENTSNGFQCFQSISDASLILATEIAQRLLYNEYSMNTLTRRGIKTHILNKDIMLVVKIRSGIAMFYSFSSVLKTANASYLLINRNTNTIEYSTVPKCNCETKMIVLDPLIGMGGTTKMIISHLINRGANLDNIQIASLLCSEKGLNRIIEVYPEITINVGFVTEELDSNAGVLPHVGDIGDRMFR